MGSFCSNCGQAISDAKKVVVTTAQGTAEFIRAACANCGRLVAIPLTVAAAALIFLGDTPMLTKPPWNLGAGPAQPRGNPPSEMAKFDVAIQVTATATAGTTGNAALDQIFSDGGDPSTVYIRKKGPDLS